MTRAGLSALCALLVMQSAAWSLEPAFYYPAPHYQIPLEKEFKRLLSGKSRKEPVLAALLALVPPLYAIQGLGQVYNGEIGKGMFFLGIGQLSFSTWQSAVDPTTEKVGRAVFIGSWVYSVIDAYRSAKRINRKRGHHELRPTFTLRPPHPLQARAYAGHSSP